MKKIFATIVLATAALSGCTMYHAVATAPGGKVYVTKTTSYIFFANNKAMICDANEANVSNCKDVTINE